jgi:hypothetical protein
MFHFGNVLSCILVIFAFRMSKLELELHNLTLWCLNPWLGIFFIVGGSRLSFVLFIYSGRQLAFSVSSWSGALFQNRTYWDRSVLFWLPKDTVPSSWRQALILSRWTTHLSEDIVVLLTSGSHSKKPLRPLQSPQMIELVSLWVAWMTNWL